MISRSGPEHPDGATARWWQHSGLSVAVLCGLTLAFYHGLWLPDRVLIKRDAFAFHLPIKQHMVERLTLTAERTRLRYEITVEDPVYLSGPATLAQQWDHRPDLEFSQNTGACDPEVADRYRQHVPK